MATEQHRALHPAGSFLESYYLANDYKSYSLMALPYVAGRVISAHSLLASAEKLFYTSDP